MRTADMHPVPGALSGGKSWTVLSGGFAKTP